MNEVLNAAGYRFAPVADPAALRERLHAAAQAGGLRGTVLLAHEGVNLMLAGPDEGVESFLLVLRAEPGFEGFEIKRSRCARMPFGRLRVKVKREIIRMDQPAIAPHGGRAPAVDARTLRRWLDRGHDDEGRPVVTLDTRNAFEVDVGTFEGAIDWRLRKFSDFPAALREHAGELEGKTVVSFCTGGIRCEKAALAMQAAGVRDVFQLEGGILRYFEEAGGAHFRGRCFVFDGREALDESLSPAAGAARAS